MTTYEELEHVRRELSGSGRVVVLDTGALITAEADAMLQALHSRSVGGVDAHLAMLAKKGARDFMASYYVGYGHKSIGDCGTTTIFIEGVSMLAAKAIQDSRLYNGQESSTRYIDFSNQPFGNPVGTPKSTDLLESLRAFYLEGLATMKAELARRHPKQENENEKVWRKAIDARAFDIMRGFLPAGAATNLAWHTQLRAAADHLARLRNHPLAEVRDIATAIQDALAEMHPSSFGQKHYEASEAYTKDWLRDHYYFDGDDAWHGTQGVTLEYDGLDHTLLKNQYARILADRPTKTEPPKYLSECGILRYSFLLDFGSFRDIQRHRAVTQRMPLVTARHGFAEWYFEQMPSALQGKARSFLAIYEKAVAALGLCDTNAQYFIPMGYRVPCRVTGDLPALIWLVELRSGVAVHPTLRTIAQTIGESMLDVCKDVGLELYLDTTPDRFNFNRGTHDIVEKK